MGIILKYCIVLPNFGVFFLHSVIEDNDTENQWQKMWTHINIAIQKHSTLYVVPIT